MNLLTPEQTKLIESMKRTKEAHLCYSDELDITFRYKDVIDIIARQQLVIAKAVEQRNNWANDLLHEIDIKEEDQILREIMEGREG